MIISGPSGVGKDTVIKKILEKRKDLKLSISYTTRTPRKGETDGKDYYFVNEKDFMDLVDRGQMLEYAEYCGNYYGTPRFIVEKELEKGNNIILKIEPQGAEQIIKQFSGTISIFIVPPSLSVLRQRLLNRGLDTPEAIEKRVEEAEKEIYYKQYIYDYIVINTAIEGCAENIMEIINRLERFHYKSEE